MDKYLIPTPWDKRTFHIDTYELTDASEEALQATAENEGHFTLKVDPYHNPENIIKHGFYYMDSLTEPVCKKENLHKFNREGTAISQTYDRKTILQIAEETFMYGRFHLDFHIPDSLADRRYMRWVDDLIEADNVFSLLYKGETAGFYAFDKNKVLLLGIKKEFQGKGLTKSFASKGCKWQFDLGYDELYTSISPANVASLNLFISLGFRLRKTVDVYHKLNGPAPAAGV
ncbi:MAG TPA: GNAT family protein [Virgibacillus sp.]|nr:GNAT family protein [Virgibacillus sp.]